MDTLQPRLRITGAPNPRCVDGFPIRHPYVEVVWASTIGPTATLMARRLDMMLKAEPAGVTVDIEDLARSVGVSGTGGNSPGARALARLEHFGFARFSPDRTHLTLYETVPGLPRRMQERASNLTLAFHHALRETAAQSAPGRPAVADIPRPDSSLGQRPTPSLQRTPDAAVARAVEALDRAGANQPPQPPSSRGH
jgi:hypothetical protein